MLLAMLRLRQDLHHHKNKFHSLRMLKFEEGEGEGKVVKEARVEGMVEEVREVEAREEEKVLCC